MTGTMEHMFDALIDRMEAAGWQEDSPSSTYWEFYKKGWRCRLYWSTDEVVFVRV